MRRDADEADEIPGGDSFLDIVANIVGILVLLVVVVGVRAARVVIVPEPQVAEVEIEQTTEAIKQAESTAALDRQDAQKLRRQAQIALSESKLLDQTRLEMATYAAKLRQELDEEREKLDEQDQKALDLNNQLAQAQLELDKLNQQQLSLFDATEPETETIHFDTTPIIKERVKDEVFVRVRGDLVTYLPIKELQQEVTNNLTTIRNQLSSKPGQTASVENTAGPIDGFQLRYLFQRRLVQTNAGVMMAGGLAVARLEELGVPQSDTIEGALAPSGMLQGRLAGIDPKKTVVTLVAYPDSFELIPELESGLRERGYRVAKLLMHQNQQMTFSTQGRESVLQ